MLNKDYLQRITYMYTHRDPSLQHRALEDDFILMRRMRCCWMDYRTKHKLWGSESRFLEWLQWEMTPEDLLDEFTEHEIMELFKP